MNLDEVLTKYKYWMLTEETIKRIKEDLNGK